MHKTNYMQSIEQISMWEVIRRICLLLFSGALHIGVMYPFHSGYLQTGTLANSEDPDKIPHNAAFHQGLHWLLIPLFHRDHKFHELPRITTK